MNVIGTITQVQDIKQGSSPRGPWRKRSFAVDGEWYSGFLNDNDLGKTVEDLQGGERVDVSFTTNGKFKNFSGVTVLAEATLPETVQDAPADVKKDNYQQRMNFLGAQTRAINYLTLAVSTDAISLPQKKADKLMALDDLLNLYTDTFAYQSWNAVVPVEGEDNGESYEK